MSHGRAYHSPLRRRGQFTIIYRRSQAEMPADEEEISEAMAEGAKFRFLSAPVETIGQGWQQCAQGRAYGARRA